MEKQDSSDEFTSKMDSTANAYQMKKLNQQSKISGTTSGLAGENEGATTTALEKSLEEDTTKFYDGYMKRVQALQQMTQEFNRELAEIEENDHEAFKLRKKKLMAPPGIAEDQPLKAIEAATSSAPGTAEGTLAD